MPCILCSFLLVIGFRKASVLLVLAFYLKILLMAPLLLFYAIADIGWGVMDRPPESRTLKEGAQCRLLILPWMV
jgi:hypothetical protein